MAKFDLTIFSSEPKNVEKKSFFNMDYQKEYFSTKDKKVTENSVGEDILTIIKNKNLEFKTSF
jgi:hypothetical protein